MIKSSMIAFMMTSSAWAVFGEGAGYRNCLKEEKIAGASLWCTPSKRPKGCKASVWEKIRKLPPKKRAIPCREGKKHH